MNFSYENIYQITWSWKHSIWTSYTYHFVCICSFSFLSVMAQTYPQYPVRGPEGHISCNVGQLSKVEWTLEVPVLGPVQHLAPFTFSCMVGWTLEVAATGATGFPYRTLSFIPLSYNLYGNVDSRGIHVGCTHIVLSCTYPDCKYLDSEPLCHFLFKSHVSYACSTYHHNSHVSFYLYQSHALHIRNITSRKIWYHIPMSRIIIFLTYEHL